jgi:uncharacterized membrane protein YgcG
MPRIVDDAGVLSPADRNRLAATATWSGAELIVHLVPSVTKRAFRQHAMAVRRQLSQHYERSVIVVLAVADRHIEIATASGYADRFDAATCNAILLQHAVPALREGRTADALAATLEEIARRLAAAPLPLPTAPRYDGPGPSRGTIVILILFLVLFLTVVAASIFGSPRGGGGSGDGSDSSWYSDSGGSDSSGSDSGSSDSGGSDGGGGADY